MKLSILIMSLLLASSVHAQENIPIRTPSVTAQGEAVITAEPDQAQIDIGVLTQARSAPDAAKENAEKLSLVLAQIKKLLGKGDEVKTTGLLVKSQLPLSPGWQTGNNRLHSR